MDNIYKKDKFILNNNYNFNNNRVLDIKNNIDNESKLITPIFEDKEKTQIVLSDTLDPKNYSLNYYDSKKDTNNIIDFYYNNTNQGPGRGFGDLNISNDIRNCNQSRSNTKIFKKEQESKQIFEFQFQYLDKNFQDPNHIVMPIPRGGESTRTQKQLNINEHRINSNAPIVFNY